MNNYNNQKLELELGLPNAYKTHYNDQRNGNQYVHNLCKVFLNLILIEAHVKKRVNTGELSLLSARTSHLK